ncbi:hypothetical protein ACLOJK_030975 [Asimina triloba]
MTSALWRTNPRDRHSKIHLVIGWPREGKQETFAKSISLYICTPEKRIFRSHPISDDARSPPPSSGSFLTIHHDIRRSFDRLIPWSRIWEDDEQRLPTAAVADDMSLSCQDCYSDLLCGESAGILDGDDEAPEYSPEVEFPEDDDVQESIIAAFVEGEGDHAPGLDYPARFRSRSLDAAAREEAVAWILKPAGRTLADLRSRRTANRFARKCVGSSCRWQLLKYALGAGADSATACPRQVESRVGSANVRPLPEELAYVGFFYNSPAEANVRCVGAAVIRSPVHAYYSFQPLTAYLAVNYMDRFLSNHRLPRPNGWPLQLLCVASLSLAAKMEETLVPSFLDLQIEGARFIFEPRTIRRMELLVLSALDWRLRSITPFSFIHFFACKVDSARAFTRFLVSRATQFVLATIREIDYLDYGPSAVAAAAVLCAAGATPDLTLIDPEKAVSWCVGLSKERILSCFGLMQTVVIDDRRRKPPKVLPQLRVTTPAILSDSGFCSLLSSSSSGNKRRKLNHRRWVDEDEDEDEDDDDDDDGER